MAGETFPFSLRAGKRYGILTLLSYPIRHGKGVFVLEILISFLVAVAAGVACHCINRLLDGDDN